MHVRIAFKEEKKKKHLKMEIKTANLWGISHYRLNHIHRNMISTMHYNRNSVNKIEKNATQWGYNRTHP